MKKLPFLLFFLIVATLATAQNIVKNNPLAGAAKVSFNFAHQSINAKTATSANIQVEIEVRANLPKTIIEQLANSGRYKLVGTKLGDVYNVTAPNLVKIVTVDGQPLQEEIIVNITMPTTLRISAKVLNFKNAGQVFAKNADISATVKAVSTLLQQHQTGFGGILIDGVTFEVE